MGHFTPNNGLAAAGTYNLYAADFAIFFIGSGVDADGNEVTPIFATSIIASTCTTGDNACDFSRTVVPVPAAVWLFASAGLGLAGFRKYLNPLS